MRSRLEQGETLDKLLPEAFAVVREASTRVLGKTQYPVQLMGALALYDAEIRWTDLHIGLVLEALDRCMPPGVRYTRPQGGMFIWVGLPEGCDAHELLALCLERDVAFVPGGSFFPNGGHENTLRLNFSAMAP